MSLPLTYTNQAYAITYDTPTLLETIVNRLGTPGDTRHASDKYVMQHLACLVNYRIFHGETFRHLRGTGTKVSFFKHKF